MNTKTLKIEIAIFEAIRSTMTFTAEPEGSTRKWRVVSASAGAANYYSGLDENMAKGLALQLNSRFAPALKLVEDAQQVVLANLVA